MSETERIEIESTGFGEASDVTLEQRAKQIALSDGRTEVNDLDREEARRQIRQGSNDRESAEETIAEGDRPDAGVAPSSTGTRAEKNPSDDETLISEKLVQEGVEEADFDTRVRAAEDEPAG